MSHTKKFIYSYNDLYILTTRVLRDMQRDYPGAEMIRSFHDVEVAREWAAKQKKQLIDLVTRRDKFDKDHRQKLRDAKLGENNPNSKGLSDTHKRRIGARMKGKYDGPNHPHYGKKRPRLTRIKISQTKKAARLQKMWIVNMYGEERLVDLGEVPTGWTRGRKRGATQ